MRIDLQTVLAIVITLVTFNILFVGYYIVQVLKDVRNVIAKADGVIDDVDKTVKDGIDKMQAMEKPLQAVATTTSAITGILNGRRGIASIKSVFGNHRSGVKNAVDDKNTEIISDTPDKKIKTIEKRTKRPRFFKKARKHTDA